MRPVEELGGVYKIQRNSDGLFSSGGITPSFSRGGKTWSSKGALMGHLAQFYNTNYDKKEKIGASHIYPRELPLPFVYEDCTIVTFQVLTTPVEGWANCQDLVLKHLEKTNSQERSRAEKAARIRQEHLDSCPYKTYEEAAGERNHGVGNTYPNPRCIDYWSHHNNP